MLREVCFSFGTGQGSYQTGEGNSREKVGLWPFCDHLNPATRHVFTVAVGVGPARLILRSYINIRDETQLSFGCVSKWAPEVFLARSYPVEHEEPLTPGHLRSGYGALSKSTPLRLGALSASSSLK